MAGSFNQGTTLNRQKQPSSSSIGNNLQIRPSSSYSGKAITKKKQTSNISDNSTGAMKSANVHSFGPSSMNMGH